MIIDPDKIDVQFGDYIRSKNGCLQDLKIIKLVDDYKHNISQKLKHIHPETLQKLQEGTSSLKIGDRDLYISIKSDGEGIFLIYNQEETETGEKVYLVNASKHRVILGLEVSKKCEEIFIQHGIHKAIIAGELFAAPLDGENHPNFSGRSRVRDVLHCLNDQETLERIGLKIFDIIELDGTNYLDKMYSARFEKITELFPETGRVARVRTYIANQNAIASLYEQIVGPIGREFENPEGHEGLVIKTPHNFRWFKVKPVHTLDAVIIGGLAGRPGSKVQPNQLSVALTAMRYADGTFQVLGRIGSGLNSDQREDVWRRMEFVDSQFISVAKDGRAFRMVKPTTVVQINFLDLYTHNIYDQPNKRPAVSYDEAEQNWKLVQPLPFVHLISPRFDIENPIREDKTHSDRIVDIFDIRVEQITDFVELAAINSVEELILPAAKILARYVYESKQKVKKFLMWQSNKHEIDPNYAEYAIFFTNYSPDRASSLDRKIRVTNNELQAWTMLYEWIQEELMNSTGNGLKKGWNLFQSLDERISTPDYRPPISSRPPKKRTKKTTKKSTKKTSKKISKKSTSKSKPQPTSKEIQQILIELTKMQNYMRRFSNSKKVVIPEPVLSLESSITYLKNEKMDQFMEIITNFDAQGWDIVVNKCTSESQTNTVNGIIKYLKKFQN